MAIKRNFKGVTLRKPGAYSDAQTTPEAGGQSPSTGVILVIGEADAGPGGAAEGIQSYSAAAFSSLRAKYRSGALVDCAKVALTPSRTPGIGGYDRILVWQTNTPTKASLELANSYGTLKDLEGGVGGNRVTFKNELSEEGECSVTGSVEVSDFGGLDGKTLLVAVDGAAASTVTFSSPASIGDVVDQINGVLDGVTASSASGALKLSLDAGSNQHRNGAGRSFEIVDGTALEALGLTAQLVVPASEIKASMEIQQPRDGITRKGVVGGEIAMQLGRDATGNCSAASVSISDSEMTLTQTGATPTSYSLSLEDYPLIGNLADAIEQLPGWTVSVPPKLRTQPSATLDKVASIGCFSSTGKMPGRIKRDAWAVSQFVADSALVSLEDQASKGLPDAMGRTNLTGGARGSSASSDFDAGLTAALAHDLNVIVIAASQDAAADILMGETDPASTYDIETLHAMLADHLTLRGSIKNRKKAQGVVGYRVPDKESAFAQAASIGSAGIQMVMEDVLVVDATGELRWKQPHVLAAMLAGMRAGSPIAEPLTHKFLAVQGVGHYVNPDTGVVGGDYNPLIDYDDAIDAGVTSTEPASGGWRVMVDNTTYGADENFVWNRGSVVEAAIYAEKYIRDDAEAYAVGRRTSVISASSLKNRIRSKAVELFEAGILDSSIDAPQGFVEETFVVERQGNTTQVWLEIKPAQGNDFVLINFSLGETRQTA